MIPTLKPKPKPLVKKQPLTVESVLKTWRTLDVKYSQKGLTTQELESYGQFFIFDDELESYVTISDAYYNGVILNEPVRIKEPITGNFVLLKDAVIKGLISCEKSDDKVTFKNRSSFFTLNRVSYIIDCVFDWKKKNKYSLQEAIKKGLLLNGVYKHAHKNESYKLDEAIDAGFIVGKRIELDKIDAIFQHWLNFPPPPPSKPTRGIFTKESPDREEESDSEPKAKKEKHTAREAESLVKKQFSKVKGERLKKFNSQDTITRSKIEPITGKIRSVLDLKNSKYLEIDVAEKLGIINFSR